MKKQALNPSSLKILGGAGLGMLGGAAAGASRSEGGVGQTILGGLAGAAGGAALGYAAPRALAARKAGMGLKQTAQMLKDDAVAHSRHAVRSLTGNQPPPSINPASRTAYQAAVEATPKTPLTLSTPTQVEARIRSKGVLDQQLRQIRGEQPKIPLSRGERAARRRARLEVADTVPAETRAVNTPFSQAATKQTAVPSSDLPTVGFKAAAARGRMTVPQSRAGRRPMSVTTLLRKEKEGTLYKHTKSAAAEELKQVVFGSTTPQEFLAQPALIRGRLLELSGLGDVLPTRVKSGSVLAAQMPAEYDDSARNMGSAARPKRAQFPSRTDTVGYPAVEGPLPYDVIPKQASAEAVFHAAFMDQIVKLAGYEQGVKIAAELDFDLLLKEARFRQALQSLKNFVTAAPKSTGVIDPSTGKEMMLSMRGGAASQGLLRGVGKSLEGSGRTLRTAQAVPGAAAPSASARVVGGALEGAGHHVGHRSTLGLAINPLGVPLGGAIEGGMRQAGKELQRAGGAVATGVRGAPTLGGGLKGSIGRGLEQHASKAGLVGEIGGVASLGTALGAPISAAGAVGGKLTAAAPLVEHALHGAGEFAHHLGADVVGGKAMNLASKGKAVAGRVGPAVGRVVNRFAGAAA